MNGSTNAHGPDGFTDSAAATAHESAANAAMI
jgi:hypothetical protein